MTQKSASWLCEVIQGRWFWYQWKARVLLRISDQQQPCHILSVRCFRSNKKLIFTARWYTERGYATVCRLSVCPSVSHAPSPRRQKSPFALMNYSFTVANNASLYLFNYAAHSIVSSIQSINSKCCWLLVRPVYSIGRFEKALPQKCHEVAYIYALWKCKGSSSSRPILTADSTS